MELWFWLAIAAAVTGGIPSFMMKMAAERQYSSELFILYSSLISVIVTAPIALIVAGASTLSAGLFWLSLFGGMIAAVGGVFRIQALRYIDTTIYYPLVKLLSPTLAIVAGVVIWQEQFTQLEWMGLLTSLVVPLLLISRVEHARQHNLLAGLGLVAVTGVLSICAVMINKYTVDIYASVPWVLFSASLGVLMGALLVMGYRHGGSAIVRHIRTQSERSLVVLALLRGVVISVSFVLVLYAFAYEGPLAVVHTIHSLYILIPIVLSIIFYNEHWNLRKIAAIVLSVAALALLG